MKGRTIIPLVLGLGIGIFAIKIFVGVLQKARASNAGELTQVVYARADISPTLEITEAMLEVKEIPKTLVPKLVFSDRAQVVGRVANTTIPNGMPLAENFLAPKGTPPGLVTKIKDGFRAVSVKIDGEWSAVSGWVKPGSRVDVVAMLNTTQGGRRVTVSKVILQNVLVLTVGQEIGSGADTGASVSKSVTLEVKPEDVSRIHLAASQSGAKLRLAMRSQTDDTMTAARVTTDNDLLTSAAGSGSDRAGGGQGTGESLLDKLFAPKAQKAADATDKGQQTPAVNTASAEPTEVASAADADTWVVEVIEGSKEPYQIRFKGSGKSAQRIANTKAAQAQPAVSPSAAQQQPAETPAETPAEQPTLESVEDDIVPEIEGPEGESRLDDDAEEADNLTTENRE